MIIGVNVTDETYQKIQDQATAAGIPVEDQLSRLLKTAADLRLSTSRVVPLVGPDLQNLEAILGGGSVLHGQDLVKKVERLAGISFRHVRLPFTPNQLEVLQEKAARNGLTVQQLVERTAPRMYEQFFGMVPV